MKKHKLYWQTILPCVFAFLVIACVLFAMLLPLSYGGASPAEHFQRYYDGGNCYISLLDAAAIALRKESAVFDITKNNESGILSYNIDLKSNQLEAYMQIGSGHKATASYILIKNGVLYSFSMDAEGWNFDGSRVCNTDFKRLGKNLVRIITDKEVSAEELKTDFNGLTGMELSEYLDFRIVPTALRSLLNVTTDAEFQQVAGYSFSRDKFELQYSFSPTDERILTEKINSVISIAYTDKASSIVSLAGFADGIADWLGFDMFEFPHITDFTFSTDYVSGKLLSFNFKTKKTDFSATIRKYGSGTIQINSSQLEALLLKHVN